MFGIEGLHEQHIFSLEFVIEEIVIRKGPDKNVAENEPEEEQEKDTQTTEVLFKTDKPETPKKEAPQTSASNLQEQPKSGEKRSKSSRSRSGGIGRPDSGKSKPGSAKSLKGKKGKTDKAGLESKPGSEKSLKGKKSNTGKAGLESKPGSAKSLKGKGSKENLKHESSKSSVKSKPSATSVSSKKCPASSRTHLADKLAEERWELKYLDPFQVAINIFHLKGVVIEQVKYDEKLKDSACAGNLEDKKSKETAGVIEPIESAVKLKKVVSLHLKPEKSVSTDKVEKAKGRVKKGIRNKAKIKKGIRKMGKGKKSKKGDKEKKGEKGKKAGKAKKAEKNGQKEKLKGKSGKSTPKEKSGQSTPKEKSGKLTPKKRSSKSTPKSEKSKDVVGPVDPEELKKALTDVQTPYPKPSKTTMKTVEHESPGQTCGRKKFPKSDWREFNKGMCCVFTSTAIELIKFIQREPLKIKVQRFNGVDLPSPVGVADVWITSGFSEALIKTNQLLEKPISRYINQQVQVKNGYGKNIGYVKVYFGLTCYGGLVTGNHPLNKEEGLYQFLSHRDNQFTCQKPKFPLHTIHTIDMRRRTLKSLIKNK